MKKQLNIEELLSAYIDGELSIEEKERLELKLQSSLELQKKLDDILQIKKTLSENFPSLPESPYFETKLFAELKAQKPWYRKAIKWSPAFGLAIATVFLMVVLKFNPQIIENIIEKQTSNIAGFYKENLQPLLFAADLNNEDIFNFAMYKQLPLNKESNQILHLGYDTHGKEYFEIRDLEKNLSGNNYEKFVVALNLNELQKLQIDSIINQYAAELQSQVLVNVNNTVAINSNLWNYQRAIQADLLAFAEKSNENQFRKFIPGIIPVSNNPVFINTSKELRRTKNKNYIILTPDSIFAEAIDYDPVVDIHKFEKRLDRNRKELNMQKHVLEQVKINFKYDSNWKKLLDKPGGQHKINIKIDSNSCRVDISQLDIPEIHVPDMDSIFGSFDSIASNFKFYSQYIPDIKYFDNKIRIDFDSDSMESYEFEIYDFDMDSIMKSQKLMLDSMRNYNFNHFFNSSDSIFYNYFPKINSYFKFFNNSQELELQMNELKKDLEQFRNEMGDLKFQYQDKSSSRKKVPQDD